MTRPRPTSKPQVPVQYYLYVHVHISPYHTLDLTDPRSIVIDKEIQSAFIVLIFPWKETPDRDFTAWRFHKYPDEHSVAGPWILCDNKLIYASVYATGKVRRHV